MTSSVGGDRRPTIEQCTNDFHLSHLRRTMQSGEASPIYGVRIGPTIQQEGYLLDIPQFGCSHQWGCAIGRSHVNRRPAFEQEADHGRTIEGECPMQGCQAVTRQ
jgi:hypothetical protein